MKPSMLLPGMDKNKNMRGQDVLRIVRERLHGFSVRQAARAAKRQGPKTAGPLRTQEPEIEQLALFDAPGGPREFGEGRWLD